LSERIAVTGLGMTTCLGVGVSENWRRLRSGDSGLAPITRIELGDYPIRTGGEAPALGATRDVDADLPFEMLHLLGAIREALGGVTVDACGASGARCGLVIGSSLAGSSTSDRFFAAFGRDGAADVDYGLLEGYYTEEFLDRLARRLGIGGPASIVSNACAAGGSSLAQGARWLLSGRVDAVLAAGFDPLSIFTLAGFGSLMALSTSDVRPFAADRDGMLLGDGFAAFVLERADDARAASREVLGHLAGWGESTDAHHLTHPHPEGEGAALAMRRALDRAGLEPDGIDYVNCHGTATPANDLAESRALRQVFGDRLADLPLSSSKPFFGHTLGGAGTVEAAVTLLAIREGFLPANLGVDATDPELGDLCLVRTGVEHEVRCAMSNSFGFGGCNTSLVFSSEVVDR